MFKIPPIMEISHLVDMDITVVDYGVMAPGILWPRYLTGFWSPFVPPSAHESVFRVPARFVELTIVDGWLAQIHLSPLDRRLRAEDPYELRGIL